MDTVLSALFHVPVEAIGVSQETHPKTSSDFKPKSDSPKTGMNE